MKKQSPKEYAQDFVDDFKDAMSNFDLTQDINVVIKKDYLEEEYLDAIKQQLKPLGFTVFVNTKENELILRKI